MERTTREERRPSQSQEGNKEVRQGIVEAKLDGMHIQTKCPLRFGEVFGECSQPGEKAVRYLTDLIIPCKKHYVIYIDNGWKDYDF